VLASREHKGPLVVQRPFYPEADERVCHVYVVHPPGGVVGGDRLALTIFAEAGAHALLTTPAAGKFYRSSGPTATFRTRIDARGDACVEWLPQETIVFSGARAEIETLVSLDPGAAFIGWEILCVGRPAAGEQFKKGSVTQRFELRRGGTPLIVERTELAGDSPVLAAPWGLHGMSAVGTLVASIDTVDAKARAREALDAADVPKDVMASVTTLSGVTVVRTLSHGAESARVALSAAWHALRPLVANRVACPPRIWRT
jgi:urease accessory protein